MAQRFLMEIIMICIFYLITKLSIYKYRKQGFRSSMCGIVTSIKIMVIILTDIYQL